MGLLVCMGKPQFLPVGDQERWFAREMLRVEYATFAQSSLFILMHFKHFIIVCVCVVYICGRGLHVMARMWSWFFLLVGPKCHT